MYVVVSMEDKIINKLFNKVKDKFTKQKQNNYNIYEYTFSDEEIESINKQNKQKILELKQGMTLKSKQDKTKPNTLEVLSKLVVLSSTCSLLLISIPFPSLIKMISPSSSVL